MTEWNYKRKLSCRILIQDDLMDTCETKRFQLNSSSKEVILFLLFFWKEKSLQCSFKRLHAASPRGLHCPVLESKWENGERTGSDTDACQISTRWWPSVHVGSRIQIQFLYGIVGEFWETKSFTKAYSCLLVCPKENGGRKTYPWYLFIWALPDQQITYLYQELKPTFTTMKLSSV